MLNVIWKLSTNELLIWKKINDDRFKAKRIIWVCETWYENKFLMKLFVLLHVVHMFRNLNSIFV